MIDICNTCVMDSSARHITFSPSGQCNYCAAAFVKLEEEYKPNSRGLMVLNSKIDAIKSDSNPKTYDCIIGLSGGVDSSYLLHKLVTTYNLRPLVVHVDCGWNSEVAVNNIQKLTESLKLDLATEVIDWPTMRDLQLAVFRSGVANADIPQDHAISAVMLKMAKKHRIKWLINGSNLSSESILPHSWGHNALDPFQLKDIAQKFGNVNLKKFPILGYFEWKLFARYLNNIKIIKPLNLMPYDKQHALSELSNLYHWEPYGGKHHESLMTRFLQEVYFTERFGFTKARAHYASLIVSEQMSRDDAILKLKNEKIDTVDRANIIRYVAQKLLISEQQLEEIIKAPEVDYTIYKNQDAFDRYFRKLKTRWSRT